MPFCPKCRYEYVEGIERCPDCDLKLVNKLHEEKTEHFDDVDIVLLAAFSSKIAADMAKLKLDSEGIESAVIGNSNWRSPGAFVAALSPGFRLMVREDDLDRARRVLAGS